MAAPSRGNTSMKTHWQILVVDDEEVMCESLAAWLREDGYVVDTASSGHDAVEKARLRDYAIYFVDLKMPGGGRKPLESRQIFAGIVYVLRTGCQWKALPKSFGSASSVHKHFQRWRGQGFFLALWQAGLAEYDDMEGIAWEWQSIDGTQGKAPLAQEAVGNNPTDRGKKRQQAQPVGGRCWRPAVPYRQRGQPA